MLNESGDIVAYQKEDDDLSKKISNTNSESEFQDVFNKKKQKKKSKLAAAFGCV